MNAGPKREFDFALILTGVHELTDKLTDALYESGCDDATVSLQYGQVYLEFTREATSLQDAIVSAIQDVYRANLGAGVLRVDERDLVTPAEIARRIKRSRQMVHQYMTGARGPGGFPPPECSVADGKPLWSWCPVSHWLSENGLIRPEAYQEAEVVAAINTTLERDRQVKRNPALLRSVEEHISRRTSLSA